MDTKQNVRGFPERAKSTEPRLGVFAHVWALCFPIPLPQGVCTGTLRFLLPAGSGEWS